MKKPLQIVGLVFLPLFQSCYFGAGLVEERLTDNIDLMAINSLDEAEIIYSEEGSSVYHTLVAPVVFSVGHDDNFIIAKSHPIDSMNRIGKILTCYHIIEVNNISKDNHRKSPALTLEQFQSKRKKLGVPEKLTFTIDLEKAE